MKKYTLLMLAAVSCTAIQGMSQESRAALSGAIVVGADVNVLSTQKTSDGPGGYPFVQPNPFAVNIATTITSSTGNKNLLLFNSVDQSAVDANSLSRNFSPGVITALTNAGFTVTQTSDYTHSLAGYGGVFVGAKFDVNANSPNLTFVDNNSLINFVDGGGGVYIYGGIGWGGAQGKGADEAALESAGWHTFLSHYGLDFATNYNGYSSPTLGGPIPQIQPTAVNIFTTPNVINGLGFEVISPIVDLGTNPNASIVLKDGGINLYAVVQPSEVPEPASLSVLGLGAGLLLLKRKRQR